MRKYFCLLVLAAFTLTSGAAALELPAVFADHMVLQRGMPVPVWGKAEPGDKIFVSLNGDILGQTHAEKDGTWRVDLPAMPVNDEPQTLGVASITPSSLHKAIPAPTIKFTDVLVGDVWHCSGQSNMRWKVKQSNDAKAEIAAADYPLIRHLTLTRTDAPVPQFSCDGEWKVTSPQTIGEFSAVGYFFGRQINQSQGVPIGLIDTAWGGASAEAFTPMDTLLDDPVTAQYVEDMNARPTDAPKFRKQHTPAAIWNGMIHPVAPFAHRGVLWYQGESNRDRAVAYRQLLPRMIEDWRSLWDQPGELRDTPFLIVQLANYQQPADQPPAFDAWGELRDGQAFTAKTMPNTFLATAIDIGNAKDIHPRNKQDVGLRLARLAEHHVYGDESVVPVGPTMREVIYGFRPAGNRLGAAVIDYDFSEGLATTDGKPPRGFAIRLAYDDEATWQWARTELLNESVVLRHPEGLLGPFEIRYAYGINPTDGPHGINLVNGEGLPAMPFRTDPAPQAE